MDTDPFAQITLSQNASLIRLCNLVSDELTESPTARLSLAGWARPVEALENEMRILGRDARFDATYDRFDPAIGNFTMKGRLITHFAEPVHSALDH